MAEKEYIERDCSKCFHYPVCDSDGECACYISAADVVEVRHGKWVDRYGGHCWNPVYICTACGHSATWGPKEAQILTNYCPTCGAKMGGKGEGE